MADFKDIQDHWAKSCIEKLADAEVLSGYEDGTFKPDALVTRAEFAAMLNRAFPDREFVRESAQFDDVKSDYWARDAITTAYRRGFMSGYQDKTFKPTQPIPRVQVLVSLANGLNYGPTQTVFYTLDATFDDAEDIPDYAKNAVAAAAENELVVNYPDVRSLDPNQAATRAEVAAFLSQALLAADEDPSVPDQYIAKVFFYHETVGELRGVWLTNIDSDVLFSTDQLTGAIDSLADLNFNTLYPTIWNGGYTLYPSSVLERVTGAKIHPEPGLQNRDMLQEIVTRGQAKGMSVIPWFEFGFMAPQDSLLMKSRPTWITTRKDGIPFVKSDGEFRVWLNPFHPQVQQFILDLVVEVVSNYDVDGIQFDDHFSLPVELGYDSFTKSLYMQEYGKVPPADPEDEEWVSWRARKITEFMMRVFWVVKEYNPDCIISLAPNPASFAYTQYLQDWKRWKHYGYIEEVVLQVYRDNLADFTRELEDKEVLVSKGLIPTGLGILTGLQDKPIPPEMVRKQIEIVRDRRFAGFSFFYYESLMSMLQEETEKTAFQALLPTSTERPFLETQVA
ncbi:family 10 glycosylhydrolase [Lyngbya sp. CCY1209]|uniref:glycoside hydrolase family 10 protein n=1 Tax=Lyngbya sp. CCY1209 TaxID=2886103 RepID=UPI002D20FBAC|nr:family 10 glycosylhydrolase [Lyngbya sp. CCY1209]MEB3882995.1 family 10 glycosylhydrolase [Lyngbya sp. CCY1209]